MTEGAAETENDMKAERQAQILRLIREYDIETQEELAGKLEESGFSVTQATVSRDIRELKLTKVGSKGGGSHYSIARQEAPDETGRYIRVLKDSLQSMAAADNILVVHTASGMAMAAAAVLDELQLEEIVGCIAGDNTIMCATHSQSEAEQVMRRLERIIG